MYWTGILCWKFSRFDIRFNPSVA